MKRLLAGAAVTLAALAAPASSFALSAQEAILRAKPAVALITARVDAEVTIDCGQGPVTVKPRPFIETGTGWLVDGRGWVVTNAHVVDPAHRLPPWVTHELKKTAIDQACVEPALQAQKMARGHCASRPSHRSPSCSPTARDSPPRSRSSARRSCSTRRESR